MNDLKSQLYYSIFIFLVALALILAKQVKADPTCDETLNLCAASEASCQELVKEQRSLVTAQDELIFKLTKQRNEALEMAAPKTSFPWYVGIVLGVAGGVILTRGLR